MTALTPQQALDLAMQHHRAGRLVEAEALYRRLLAADPNNADVLHLLGVVASETRRYPEAFDWFQRAIAARPNVACYYNNLGLLLFDWGRLDESATALETARQLDPRDVETHFNLGNTRSRQWQWESAIASYRRALQLEPRHMKAWLNLGLALTAADRCAEAVAAYQTAQRHCPGECALAINLAGLFQDLGQLDDAVAVLRSALALAPQNVLVLNNLAILLKDRGEIPEALDLLRQSLALQASAEVHSNLIFTLLFAPETSPAVVQAEQREWNIRHAEPLRAQRPRRYPERSADRRLRIGYVSADLRNHVVGRALLPIFEAHDANQVECVCYAHTPVDGVAARFQARADLWRSVERMDDATLAAQIQADGINILVDLGLHTAFNRLLTFARKPAPVQVSWLGYPGPSGVETMDYWLTDRFLDQPGTEADEAGHLGEMSLPSFLDRPGTEAETAGRPFRLPGAWCCHVAPEDSPAVGESPAARTGRVTFGTFHNFAKINERVLFLWARILHAVPGSRLLLLAKAGAHRDRASTALQRHGIAPPRFEFLAYEPSSPERTGAHFLRRYAEVDIALDTFPYNGMTTTCDALWMGVPVVSLAGETQVSRGGLSLLNNLGLPELVAQAEDDYVETATRLAHDLPRLAELRRTLRSRMEASVLMDVPLFTRNLEAAYRAMWRHWCGS